MIIKYNWEFSYIPFLSYLEKYQVEKNYQV